MLKFIWIVIALLLGTSMIRTLWLSHLAQAEMRKRQESVEKIEQETATLEAEVREATASFTLEKRVREELELHRDGETILRIEP